MLIFLYIIYFNGGQKEV